MIVPEDYRLPKEQSKHEPTYEERQRAEETLAYLESLPWRPFIEEW